MVLRTSKPDEVLTAWRKRLKAGKDKQGHTYLHRNINGVDEFCVNGILCDLASQAGVIGVPARVGQTYFYEQDYAFVLPDEVRMWAGLTPVFAQELEILNDAGKTFKQLAKIIGDYQCNLDEHIESMVEYTNEKKVS